MLGKEGDKPGGVKAGLNHTEWITADYTSPPLSAPFKPRLVEKLTK